MVVAGLLLAAQQVPQTVIESADAANLAYVQCLFAVSRESSEAGLSLAQFEGKLQAACLAEGRALKQISTKVFRLRGNGDAAINAEQLDRDARRGMVENYKRSLEVGPKLQELAEICRAQPEACHD